MSCLVVTAEVQGAAAVERRSFLCTCSRSAWPCQRPLPCRRHPVAELPLMVQLLSVAVLEMLPNKNRRPAAELPWTVHLVGAVCPQAAMLPPSLAAELPLTVQWVMRPCCRRTRRRQRSTRRSSR